MNTIIKEIQEIITTKKYNNIPAKHVLGKWRLLKLVNN